MTMKSKLPLKKRLIYVVDPETMNDAYEFKYELSGAIDEVIDSIKGLKNIIDVWMPLAFNDCLTKEPTDEQDSGPFPF